MENSEQRETPNITNLLIKNEPFDEEDYVIMVTSKPSLKKVTPGAAENQLRDPNNYGDEDAVSRRPPIIKISNVFSLNQSTISENNSPSVESTKLPDKRTNNLLLVRCPTCRLFVSKSKVKLHTANCLASASTAFNLKFRGNSTNISKVAPSIISPIKKPILPLKILSNNGNNVENTQLLHNFDNAETGPPLLIAINSTDSSDQTFSTPPELVAEIVPVVHKNQTELPPPDIDNMLEDINDSSDDLLLKDSTFSCSLCSFTHSKRRTLKEHERNHRRNNSQIYKCVYCEQRYAKNSLYIHMQSIHPGQKLRLGDLIETDNNSSSNSTNSVSNYTKFDTMNDSNQGPPSQDMNRDISLYRCSKCSYVSNKKYNVTSHEVRHRRGELLFECTGCGFKSTLQACRYHETSCTKNSSEAVKIRLVKKNPKSKVWSQGDENDPPVLESVDAVPSKAACLLKVLIKCQKCSFTANKEAVLTHESICLKDLEDIPSYKFNFCNKCSYKTTISRDMLKHKRQHNENAPIIFCTKGCGFRSTKRAVQSHLRKCNFKLTFGCVECDFSTNLRVKLNAHIKLTHQSVHTDGEREINVAEPTETNISNQSNNEDNEPFQIDLMVEDAGNVTPQKTKEILTKSEELQTSQKEKKSKKTYDCLECSFSTIYAKSLTAHNALHLKNVEIVSCTNLECDYKATANALRLHMLNCPNKKIIQCKLCRFSTEFPIKFYAHMERRHPNKNKKLFDCSYSSYSDQNQHLLKQKIHSHKMKQSNEEPLRRRNENSSTSLKEVNSVSEQLRRARQISQNKQLKCPICSKIMNSCIGLTIHLRTHKALFSKIYCKIDQKNENIWMICRKCSFKTKTSDIENHKCSLEDDKLPPVLSIASVDKEKNKKDNSVEYKCDTCEYSADLKIKLNQHKRKSHGEHLCEDKTIKKRKLNISKLTEDNSNVELYCRFCSFTTKKIDHKKRHELIHINKNSPAFNCPYCSHSALYLAMKTHLKNKHPNHKHKVNEEFEMRLLKCEKCPYSTNYATKLMNHESGSCNTLLRYD